MVEDPTDEQRLEAVVADAVRRYGDAVARSADTTDLLALLADITKSKRNLESERERLREFVRQRQSLAAAVLLPVRREIDLTRYLWSEIEPTRVRNVMFPSNRFGTYVLSRDRVINTVMDCIAEQNVGSMNEESSSVYLSGCRGSGKTSILMLLARAFKEQSYEVYFFKSASGIPEGAEFVFQSLVKDKSKRVDVLIDEVESEHNSGLFTELLKYSDSNVVVIGAAVPNNTYRSAAFKATLNMSDLVLKEDDVDFKELVQYFVDLNVAPANPTREICFFLLNYCGGHVYPTVAFIEYFFTDSEAKACLGSYKAFKRFFFGENFVHGPCYSKVQLRCFTQLSEEDIKAASLRMLRGRQLSTEITTLTRLGWWDGDVSYLISLFLASSCLQGVKPDKDAIYLKPSADDTLSDETCRDNTEAVIIAGLKAMEDTAFTPPNTDDYFTAWNSVGLMDSVSFNWAYRAKTKVKNASLLLQARSSIGRVDFYLNEVADTVIGVLLNATHTKDSESIRSSQDIDEHVERFHSGKCHCIDERYVLLHFALNNDKVVLPKDRSTHDKVYTYVRATNTLYRGSTPLRHNAVIKLGSGLPPCTPRTFQPSGVGHVKQFSTSTMSAISVRFGRAAVNVFREVIKRV